MIVGLLKMVLSFAGVVTVLTGGFLLAAGMRSPMSGDAAHPDPRHRAHPERHPWLALGLLAAGLAAIVLGARL